MREPRRRGHHHPDLCAVRASARRGFARPRKQEENEKKEEEEEKKKKQVVQNVEGLMAGRMKIGLLVLAALAAPAAAGTACELCAGTDW